MNVFNLKGGIKMINNLSIEVHKNAVDHGWWEEERSFGEIIALCHSELSEALEEFRNGHMANEIYYSGTHKESNTLYVATAPTQICKKPEGIPIELADCIIRILDYCCKENIDIEAALKIKHEYNKSRPYRHGGKTI